MKKAMKKRNSTIGVRCVRNEQGISVKRCCGSCAFRRLTKTGARICRLKERKVWRSNSCEWWEMNYSLTQAGKR